MEKQNLLSTSDLVNRSFLACGIFDRQVLNHMAPFSFRAAQMWL